VFTIWHTLEHTVDPREVLARAWRWIRPSGFLVVDMMNYEGTDARQRWAAWEGWQAPSHFCHFTPRTLGGMLSRHGFQVTRMKRYHSETVRNRLKEPPLFSLVARPIAKLFSGTSYAVVAEKTGRSSAGEVRDGAK
jgi:2-polyprenyl-3-methyl-5-hydroxy-6-metoxy-1,4-benzoquinol methylase